MTNTETAFFPHFPGSTSLFNCSLFYTLLASPKECNVVGVGGEEWRVGGQSKALSLCHFSHFSPAPAQVLFRAVVLWENSSSLGVLHGTWFL